MVMTLFLEGLFMVPIYLKNILNLKLVGGVIYDSIWKRSFIINYNIKHDTKMKRSSDTKFRNDIYKFNPKIIDFPDERVYYHYKKREGSIQNFKKEDLEYVNTKIKKRRRKKK